MQTDLKSINIFLSFLKWKIQLRYNFKKKKKAEADVLVFYCCCFKDKASSEQAFLTTVILKSIYGIVCEVSTDWRQNWFGEMTNGH